MNSKNWERFTKRARHVLSLAQEEAERLNYNYIGSEHILIGLLLEEGGVAGRVLRELGLETGRVQAMVEGLAGVGTRTPFSKVELSPTTMSILESAVYESRLMGQYYISTEHLLLGLIRQEEGVAVELLERFDVSPEQIRQETIRVLKEKPGSLSKPAERRKKPLPKPLEFVDTSLKLKEYSNILYTEAVDSLKNDPAGAHYLLAKSVDTMIALLFWEAQRIFPKPKAILLELEEIDPRAGRLANAFWTATDLDEKLDVAGQLAGHILGKRGFYEGETALETKPIED